METITSNAIRNFIIKGTNDLDELLIYLDKDFKETIDGIFRALFSLMKTYNQNKDRVEYLINILEQVVEFKKSRELTCFIPLITTLENKVDKLSMKDKVKMMTPYTRIKQLLVKIENKSKKELDNNKLKYLEYLIFYEQDLNLIESFIEIHPELLKDKNETGNDIIEEVINRYLRIDEKDINKINYLYQVLFILLNSEQLKEITPKIKKKYIKLIKESKIGYKEHIMKIIELLNPNFKVELRELEEKYNINFNFPINVLEEASKIKINHEGRVDYTYQNCITIDGASADCLDDALYIEENIDGTYSFYVYITDMASLIPYESIINEEARKRIKTWYYRQGQLILYPDNISYNLGSLVQDEARNVIAYKYTLDNKFRLISKFPEVSLGVIKVRHRLSFSEVDNMYDSQNDDELKNVINKLASFALERRKSTSKKEKYRFYENWINTQSNHESLVIDTSISANIVHESMFLVNYTIAMLFKKLNLPYGYRKIVIPSADYIDKQIEIIKQLDESIITDKTFINKLKESAMKSVYSDVPVYHNGLKVECCSHSSCPARRYMDAFCQYIIHDLLINNNLQNVPIWQYRLTELVKYLNIREKELAKMFIDYNYLSYKKVLSNK